MQEKQDILSLVCLVQMRTNIKEITMDKFKVCVRCITYNHADYIVDAMNGFCVQSTEYPFVCCIIDDASTDGEANVIMNFVQKHFNLNDKSTVKDIETDDYRLIFAQHKTNVNCFFVILLLKYNHYSIRKSKDQYLKEWFNNSTYIALCEGDDYWIDSAKIQKQVSYMEEHPECSMTLSNGYGLMQKEKLFYELNPIPIRKSRILSMHELLLEEGGLIPTASMCYRTNIGNSRPEEFSTPYVGDRPLRMWCGVNGTIFYDVNPMVVYRQGSVGSFSLRTQLNLEYAQSVLTTMNVFLDNFDKYTHFKYHDDVTFMKNREEWYFYNRTNDNRMYNCSYFKSLPFNIRMKYKTKAFIRRYLPIIDSFLIILKKMKSQYTTVV